VLDQHLRREHRDKLRSSSKAHQREDNWRRDHIIVGVHFQSWARNDVSRAWIVLLGDKSSSTAPRRSSANIEPASSSIQGFVDASYGEILLSWRAWEARASTPKPAYMSQSSLKTFHYTKLRTHF
jgi:hypothetical protein